MNFNASLNHNPTNRCASGMRPTGALHIGHYFGALKNWAEMQNNLECFFFVVDWHALTSDYADTRNIKPFIIDMVKDWMAAGVDPAKASIYIQSKVPSIAELTLILGMLTPISWLERCPTYKEQIENISHKDLHNYGFLGYPVLMTADIIILNAEWVPVGIDQAPHLEMTREIARRFNSFYGNVFTEPKVKLTPTPKCPGLDGRKMSKSYNNSIFLTESSEQLALKIKGMLTDPARVRRNDPGNPKNCNLFAYHELLTDADTQAEICAGCTSASMGCTDCKKILFKNMDNFIAPMRERRLEYDKRPELIWDILSTGARKANEEAKKTMDLVYKAMHLSY